MGTIEVANFKLRVLKHVSNIIKEGKTILPVMYVRTIKGKYKIMAIHPNLLEDKRLRDKCRETMQYMLKVSKADLLCFVSEAYVSAINAESLEPAQKARLESGDLNRADYEKITNNRKECLFLSFESKKDDNDNNEFMTFKIENKTLLPYEHSNKINESTDSGEQMKTHQGNFSNLFEA
jgi:hypothetical protein